MFVLMISIFLLGVLFIALEDNIGINKAATAILTAVVLWVVLGLADPAIVRADFTAHLGDISETLFFVMGSMVIIELIDTHGGFRIITNHIHTTKKRNLLWVVSLITFFLSAVLDNLATGIVMIALLRKLIPHRRERWIYSSMIIIAANAGGSWSPVGDVTTILLWTHGNLTPIHQVSHLFFPALLSMIVSLLIVTRFFKPKANWGAFPIHRENSRMPEISRKSRIVILGLGVFSIAIVPVFNGLTGLPPFLCILTGAAVLWVYTDLMYGKHDGRETKERFRVTAVLSRIDMSTILFFLGILMSVAALDSSGQLKVVSGFLNQHIGHPLPISFMIGVMSSFVDNVALVAATMGMYDIDPESIFFMVDGRFWTFLAYCAVTGGSLLIIGSATGVTVMGMEKISFMYYLKRFSLVALSGYVAGAALYFIIIRCCEGATLF